MNRPGHILTGIAFFSLYQKEWIHLKEIFPEIKWEKFVLFYEKTCVHSCFLFFILLLLTLFGSIFPDYDLKLKEFFNDPYGKRRYLYHRQITHSLLLWILAFFYASYTQNIYLFYFTIGGISHLFGDMITGTIPIFLWGKYYKPLSRIGIGVIYKNPNFYSKLSSFLDKAMIFAAGFSIAIMLI